MILAIDLSSRSGWCVGRPGCEPALGLWELPSNANPGRQAAAFSDCLADAITMHNPSLVMLEADVNLHRQNPGPTAYQQLGMLYLAELICYRREVRMRIASATDARMSTIGRARWAKGEAKNVVLAWVADQGMRITDHNIADAYVLWRHACQALENRAA